MLNSKETVDKIIESKQCIVVNHQIIPIRPYVMRNKRKISIKIMSPIMSVRNGFSSKMLSHIISFRRQVYIDPEDLKKIPSRISIDLDDTTFWIYISSNSSACFYYKQEGHIAKNCPNRSNLNTNNLSILPGNEQLLKKTTDSSKQFPLSKVDFPSLPAPSNSQKSKVDNQDHPHEPNITIKVLKYKRPPPSSNAST